MVEVTTSVSVLVAVVLVITDVGIADVEVMYEVTTTVCTTVWVVLVIDVAGTCRVDVVAVEVVAGK